MQPTWRVATGKVAPKTLALNVVLSGLFHYLNNEVRAFVANNGLAVSICVLVRGSGCGCCSCWLRLRSNIETPPQKKHNHTTTHNHKPLNR